MAIFINRKIRIKNNNNTNKVPKKPVSSPRALKMKSVCCSGINFNLVN